MIEIVFVACLLAQPELCEERVLPAFTDVTEIQCMMGGQFALAAWSRANGHLRIASWRCQPVRLAEREV